LKKTEITLSDVCSSYQSLCAKCYVFGFESELSRQSHNTYHVTALLQTSERKNIGFASLKNCFYLNNLNNNPNLNDFYT